MNVVLVFRFEYIFNFLFYIYRYKNAYVKKAVHIFYVLAFIKALINNRVFILPVRLQSSFDTQGLTPQMLFW